ncbi:MAG: hypothetical protein WDO73_10805 [Ignavibacteriota bacterium]
MLALLAYVRYVERPDRRRYALLLLAFAAGLMSKAMIVTLPLAALLLDIWPLRRKISKTLIVEKLPLFALSAAVSALVFVAQRSGGAVLHRSAFARCAPGERASVLRDLCVATVLAGPTLGLLPVSPSTAGMDVNRGSGGNRGPLRLDHS